MSDQSPLLPASTPPDPRRPSGRDLDALEKARPDDGHAAERRSLRIAIVTENFLPKIDGVTRTLAMLLEHLQAEGHEAMVLGPATPLKTYAGAEVVATKGIPLLGVYRGLGLNFLRPRFIRKLREFKPDVIQFTDPIWLCAQTIPMVQLYFPDTPLVSSYHTNLAMYATLFGFSWLTPIMWALQRNLHGRCDLSFCPSPSTARMLEEQGFENLRIWPRGVDVELFRPQARDYALRQAWGAEPQDLDADRPSPRVQAVDSNRPADDLPALALPPPYTPVAVPYFNASGPSKLVVMYVGRISWEKNLRLLIEAFRGLQDADPAQKRPACQLIFVGDGPARVEAETLCAKYGLGAQFLGFRKGEQLAAAYASADIFAFPSFTETFGQVVSEAQASGLPVVGLRAEGVSDLVEHGETGLLLDLNELAARASGTSIALQPRASNARAIPADVHALLDLNSDSFPVAVEMYRDLLKHMAIDHEHRRIMTSAAYQVASKRSWYGAMEQLVDGYRELSTLRTRPQAKAAAHDPPALSRVPTVELNVVCDTASADADETAAASSATTTPKRRRLLRLNGVLRRTGGRIREGSVTLPPLRSWLSTSSSASTESVAVEIKNGEKQLLGRLLELVVFISLLSLAVSALSRSELLTEVLAA